MYPSVHSLHKTAPSVPHSTRTFCRIKSRSLRALSVCSANGCSFPNLWFRIARASENSAAATSYSSRRVQRFLSQPFHGAEQVTGLQGVVVDIKDTIKGFNEIMDGKHDDLPEAAFNLVGTIEEARAKGEKMLEEAKSATVIMAVDSSIRLNIINLINH